MNKLLFVCGFPSGGTDLTKTILNVHPDICLNGEMPLLINIAKYGYTCDTQFRSLAEIETFQQRLAELNTWNNIKNIQHNFADEIEAKKELSLTEVLQKCFSEEPCPIWGNKTPQNTENIESLATIFPEAYFLIVVRDVRDVCLSWHNKWGKDIIWCSEKWGNRMKTGWDMVHMLPESQYTFIKFEDILLQTEVCYRKICEFLDIPFSLKMLEHHQYTPESIDGKINYGQKINQGNMEKWRRFLPEKTLKRIEEIAFETMSIYNYTPEFAAEYKPITRLEKTRGMWRDSSALLMIGNRARQKNLFKQRLQNVGFEVHKRFLT
ncbi:MAG: sulfotransferase [Chloroflexi bacterium]|nr:sulfotransferase [Chloroflexota bacterium]